MLVSLRPTASRLGTPCGTQLCPAVAGRHRRTRDVGRPIPYALTPGLAGSGHRPALPDHCSSARSRHAVRRRTMPALGQLRRGAVLAITGPSAACRSPPKPAKPWPSPIAHYARLCPLTGGSAPGGRRPTNATACAQVLRRPGSGAVDPGSSMALRWTCSGPAPNGIAMRPRANKQGRRGASPRLSLRT